MGKSKDHLFTEEQVQLGRWAKALGHPARIAILQEVVSRGACICGDLVDVLPLSQATVSQHLKALKEAGILRGDVNGRTVCYCADDQNCMKALGAITEFVKKISSCC